jgi:hypothetical protein
METSVKIANTCSAANVGQKATMTVVTVALVLVLLATGLLIRTMSVSNVRQYLVELVGPRGITIVVSPVLRSPLLRNMEQGDGVR